MPSLDIKKVIARIQIDSLGEVELKYVSGGDVMRYFELKEEKGLSDKEFVSKILHNQLLKPVIEFSKFQEIEDDEIIKIARSFIKADQSLFKNYKNTGNFFKDFRDVINKYLEEHIEQTIRFLEPFRKEAERSFQRVYETIKSIQDIVPKITLPDLPTFDRPIESKLLSFKSPEISREENNWQRHKDLMDSLNASLETQKEFLKEQKETSSLTKWILFVAILTLIITFILLLKVLLGTSS